MTPEEHQIIASYATAVYNNVIASTIIPATGYGMYAPGIVQNPPFRIAPVDNGLLLGITVLGIIIATHTLVVKSWTHSRILLLVCLTVSFVAMTWTIFADEAFSLIQEPLIFVEVKPEVQGGLEAQAQIADQKTLPLDYLEGWFFTVPALLSDFIVVWRACILFQQERRWKIALTLLMIMNAGVNIADCILDDIEIKVIESNFSTILDLLSIVTSLGVNLFED
ncbi:hypothetical protein GYMLUDRAFT_249981 [Collybiopsis luxurians FD-317 M1]|uniref:Uncharacterized protein n=1 Tax=Collybiopsis luxurians FD-317 M1 TaxID=944289 RepID=A0A0D0C7P3_9AGAR|nr:hypothetical protein GYMLUDRAFT_249981 [Collybiopsis luxurians FD-317 M1]